MRSPYEVLQVPSDADDEAVRTAYRERVKETHPDLGGDEETFRLVVSAYEAIQDGESFDAAPDWRRRRPAPDTPRSPPASVEYLNYEVLSDHGWTLEDDSLFEAAAAADLDPVDYGQLQVEPDESLLEAAEREGFAWPFACRGGACANCAVSLCEGELSQPVDHILPDDLVEAGYRLSCNGRPASRNLRVVYNVKHRPTLDDLRLPPYPFEAAHRTA